MVNAIAHIHIKTPRLTKQGFVAWGAAAMPVAGGLALAIGLRFHHHAPPRRAIRLAFHQQAPDQLRRNLLGGAGEEGLGEWWEGRSGYGSGLEWWVEAMCYLQMAISTQTKLYNRLGVNIDQLILSYSQEGPTRTCRGLH